MRLQPGATRWIRGSFLWLIVFCLTLPLSTPRVTAAPTATIRLAKPEINRGLTRVVRSRRLVTVDLYRQRGGKRRSRTVRLNRLNKRETILALRKTNAGVRVKRLAVKISRRLTINGRVQPKASLRGRYSVQATRRLPIVRPLANTRPPPRSAARFLQKEYARLGHPYGFFAPVAVLRTLAGQTIGTRTSRDTTAQMDRAMLGSAVNRYRQFLRLKSATLFIDGQTRYDRVDCLAVRVVVAFVGRRGGRAASATIRAAYLIGIQDGRPRRARVNLKLQVASRPGHTRPFYLVVRGNKQSTYRYE